MSEALADTYNNPSQALINLFAAWSTSGAAMLMTGHTPVDRLHLEHAGNVCTTVAFLFRVCETLRIQNTLETRFQPK